jgi:autotransporter-associated beta strand protein
VAAGDWSIGSNWGQSAAPTAGEYAYIDNGGTATITQPGATCGNLFLGASGGVSGNVQLTAGALTVSGSEILGYSNAYPGGVGSFTQSGGTNSIASALDLAYANGGNGGIGMYNLSGNGYLSAHDEFIGDNGNGVFSHSGGTNAIVGSLWMGSVFATPGYSSTYNLSGSGYLSAAAEHVGGGTVFNQTGGYNVVAGTLDLDGFTHSGQQDRAFYNLGGGSLSAASVYVGYAFGQHNAFNLSGSGYLSSPNEYIGWNATGSFVQSGGTNNAGNVYLGGSIEGGNSYYLNGGLLVPGKLHAGKNYPGGPQNNDFYFNGGTLQVTSSSASNLNFDNVTTYAGAGGAIVDVEGSDSFYFFYMGQRLLHDPSLGTTRDGGFTKYGTGCLTLGNPSSTFNGTTLVAAGTLSVSEFALQNSTLDTSGSGFLLFGGPAMLGGLQGSGSLALSNLYVTSVALSVGGNNSDTTFCGNLTGSGSLTKVGTGKLVLAGTDTYTGGTTVTAGRLVAADPFAFEDGASITVGSAAAFSQAPTVSDVDGANGGAVTVPEPSTLALLCLGTLLPLGFVARRAHKYLHVFSFFHSSPENLRRSAFPSARRCSICVRATGAISVLLVEGVGANPRRRVREGEYRGERKWSLEQISWIFRQRIEAENTQDR